MCNRCNKRKPRNMWADICNHRRMVAPVITSIQDIEDSQGGSAVPRLGVTEEGMDDQER